MPTVLRFGGFRVVVYPNDHRPAHVHVIGRDHEALFELQCPEGPVRVRENYGFARHEMARILTVLQENVAMLCRGWEEIHGSE